MTKDSVAVALLRPINPALIIVLGVYTIVWGLWILNPWTTVFTQAPLYSAMAGIASETFWGTTAIIFGAITSYGAMKPEYRNLRIGSFAAALHWFIIALLYFVGDWHATGGISALTFFIYSGLIWVNIRVNRDIYER